MKGKKSKSIIKMVIFLSVVELIMFPMPILARNFGEKTKFYNKVTENYIKNKKLVKYIGFPESKDLTIKKVSYHIITAYTSEVGQCDNSPCITASGFNVCRHNQEDTIAANFLKFGTKIRIPELFGDRIFIVRDRMNKKYNNRIDIWMKNKQQAVKLGKKLAKIEILNDF